MTEKNMDLAFFVGKRIRQLRKARNMKQYELGKRVNKSANTISEYEKGLRVPNSNILLKLSEIFSVDIKEFYPETATNNVEFQQMQFGFVDEIHDEEKLIKPTNNLEIIGFNHEVIAELNEYVGKMNEKDKNRLINYVEVTFEMFKRNNPELIRSVI